MLQKLENAEETRREKIALLSSTSTKVEHLTVHKYVHLSCILYSPFLIFMCICVADVLVILYIAKKFLICQHSCQLSPCSSYWCKINVCFFLP